MRFRLDVVIPSFKDPRILETISSINAQEFDRSRIKISVIDGGSGADFCESVSAKLASHDKLVSEPDDGIFDAINKGIRQASGDIICVLGSDDRFETVSAAEILDQAFVPGVDYCVSDMIYSSQDWTPRRIWPATMPTPFNLLVGRQVCHFAFYARKSVYDVVGYFDQRYRTAADYDFFWRVAKTPQLRGVKRNDRLVNMRLGGNSSQNLSALIAGNKDIAHALREHCPIRELPLLAKPLWKSMEIARAVKPSFFF